MIAVCCPTRGMLFTRTMECMVSGMKALQAMGIETQFFTTFDLPIPDGHNKCAEDALAAGAEKLFFVEEDMYIPPDAFVALAISPHEMVTLQYNDKNGRPHGIIEFDTYGQVVWCGLGATCITRHVFDLLDRPIFFTERRWKNIRENGRTRYERVSIPGPYQYGGLDVDFCFRVHEKGIKIEWLKEYKAHHFQLTALGEPYTNRGMHQIRCV